MKAGTDVELPECNCLACGRVVDVATSVEDQHAPHPGDFTICMYCGHIMAFDNDLMIRELSNAEAREVAGDPRILEIQKARGHIMGKKNETYH